MASIRVVRCPSKARSSSYRPQSGRPLRRRSTSRRLFPVVETEWADAARAVEQVQPAAVLAAASGIDEARLAPLATRVATRQPYLPLIAVDPDMSLPDNAIPFFQAQGNVRSAGGAPARGAARPLAACDRDAPAGAGHADGAVGYRYRARRDRSADRPRRRLPYAVSVARRASTAWSAHSASRPPPSISTPATSTASCSAKGLVRA